MIIKNFSCIWFPSANTKRKWHRAKENIFQTAVEINILSSKAEWWYQRGTRGEIRDTISSTILSKSKKWEDAENDKQKS